MYNVSQITIEIFHWYDIHYQFIFNIIFIDYIIIIDGTLSNYMTLLLYCDM